MTGLNSPATDGNRAVMTDPIWYALSIKQPWAGLIVAGLKTVEVRTWGTSRRGKVLIHAARNPDPRPDGWAWVNTPAVQKLTEMAGGIIGVVELGDVVRYDSEAAFAADVERHRVPTEWVSLPVYGFEFQHARPLPFQRLPGKMFFFPVSGTSATAPEAGGA